jgi:hypothetical protein
MIETIDEEYLREQNLIEMHNLDFLTFMINKKRNLMNNQKMIKT